ncbi:unnamed protein product, partial [Didymodactylos carnosus]
NKQQMDPYDFDTNEDRQPGSDANTNADEDEDLQNHCAVFDEEVQLDTMSSGFKRSFTEIYQNIENQKQSPPTTDEERKKAEANIKFLK